MATPELAGSLQLRLHRQMEDAPLLPIEIDQVVFGDIETIRPPAFSHAHGTAYSFLLNLQSMPASCLSSPEGSRVTFDRWKIV